MNRQVLCPHCDRLIDRELMGDYLPRCKARHSKTSLPSLPQSEIDEQVRHFRKAIKDPNVIPLTIELSVAMGMASLLQFALRHPDVIEGTDHLVAMMRPFTDLLIEAIIARSGEHADTIAQSFARGWDEKNDITRQEFDLIYGDTEPFFTDDN